MAERELPQIKTQAELMTYLEVQRQNGADQYSYFVKVAQRIEEYGEIGRGLKPDKPNPLVGMLAMIAFAAASGRLEAFEEKVTINGVSNTKTPGIAIGTWFDYWFTQGITEPELTRRYRQSLPDGIFLKDRGDSGLKMEVGRLLNAGNSYLRLSLNIDEDVFRGAVRRAVAAKSVERRKPSQ